MRRLGPNQGARLELAAHLDWLRESQPQVAVVAIAHPSSFGFAYDKWVPRVREAFAVGTSQVQS